MNSRQLFRKSVKPYLRPLKRFVLDQQSRATLMMDRLSGREPWVRPEIRCRRTRLGTGDGEWWICPDNLRSESIVYSVGVGYDISFDRALIEQFGVQVHAFDPTPISQQWLSTQTLPEGFHFHPFGLATYDGVAHFTLPEGNGVSFTMSMNTPGSTRAQGKVHRFGTILETLGHERVHLLKLDIEGSEYDIVPELAAAADRIDQLLIEFHHRMVEGGRGLEMTRRALATLRDAGFRLFNISPRGLEYSFLRV